MLSQSSSMSTSGSAPRDIGVALAVPAEQDLASREPEALQDSGIRGHILRRAVGAEIEDLGALLRPLPQLANSLTDRDVGGVLGDRRIAPPHLFDTLLPRVAKGGAVHDGRPMQEHQDTHARLLHAIDHGADSLYHMVMTRFQTFDGLSLDYQDEGDGVPVVLLHGFASDTDHDWRATGVWPALVASGHRVIGLDARGHGRSAKPHDPTAYADDAMSRDVLRLFDYLGLEQANVLGYSMGAAIALRVTVASSRVHRLVLGGTSGHLVTQARSAAAWERRQRLAAALRADDPATISDPAGHDLRHFADHTGADRAALAAIQLAPNRFGPPADVSAVRVPTLVICGDRDVSPDILASTMPNAQAKTVTGDHSSAIGAGDFAAAILAFLA